MDRQGKKELVAELHEAFNSSGVVVVTHPKGLSVEESQALRRQVGEVGASFKVTKNRLAKIALKDTPYAHLADHFVGESAIAYSQDPLAAAKAIEGYAKTNKKITIAGGGLGERPLSDKDVVALANLPSLDELRGKIIGVLQAPASKLVGVFGAPGGQIARVIKAYGDKS